MDKAQILCRGEYVVFIDGDDDDRVLGLYMTHEPFSMATAVQVAADGMQRGSSVSSRPAAALNVLWGTDHIEPLAWSKVRVSADLESGGVKMERI
jgi:hypothetical protein